MRTKTKDILAELKRLKQLAHINRFNAFNDNNVKTKQDVEDYLNKEWNWDANSQKKPVRK